MVIDLPPNQAKELLRNWFTNLKRTSSALGGLQPTVRLAKFSTLNAIRSTNNYRRSNSVHANKVKLKKKCKYRGKASHLRACFPVQTSSTNKLLYARIRVTITRQLPNQTDYLTPKSTRFSIVWMFFCSQRIKQTILKQLQHWSDQISKKEKLIYQLKIRNREMVYRAKHNRSVNKRAQSVLI